MGRTGTGTEPIGRVGVRTDLTIRGDVASPRMEPAHALERIVYLMDWAREEPYRVRAYLRAAEVVKTLAPDELAARVAAGTLQQLDGIGPKTAAIIAEVVTSGTAAYL